MQLRSKVVLLAVVPPVLLVGLMALGVEVVTQALADRQVAEAERILLAAKQDELRDLMLLARRAIRELEDSGRDDPETRARVLEVLRGLDISQDGYFFVYELSGRNLMHPRLPQFEGRYLGDLVDDTGQPVIRPLIARARSGGGFVRGRWNRPSQEQRWGPKLFYVVPLPRWGWMLGTGFYLDEVEAITREIRTSSSAVLGKARILLAVIGVVAAGFVAALSVMLNVTQQRFADAKLQALNWQVMAARGAERARLARELHDGVMQDLVAVRFDLETALEELRPRGAPPGALAQGLAGLVRLVDEIRRISRDLRPPLRREELPSALEQAGAAFSKRTSVAPTFDLPAALPPMSNAAAMALLQVTRQALDNIERHASATRVTIRLVAQGRGSAPGTTLTVSDDGRGFDVEAVEHRRDGGIGLRTMRERIEAIGGRLAIRSSAEGTEIEACLPGEILAGGPSP